jgi:hypothetical protein
MCLPAEQHIVIAFSRPFSFFSEPRMLGPQEEGFIAGLLYYPISCIAQDNEMIIREKKDMSVIFVKCEKTGKDS